MEDIDVNALAAQAALEGLEGPPNPKPQSKKKITVR